MSEYFGPVDDAMVNMKGDLDAMMRSLQASLDTLAAIERLVRAMAEGTPCCLDAQNGQRGDEHAEA